MMLPQHIDVNEVPMSRTHQYRKVMKPLLERKRRARINKCLDELKDLMVYALQSEGESITKLEKADVLELTVRHLEKLKRHRMLQANPSEQYRAGFSACASEVSRFLTSVPGVDVTLGSGLLSHLSKSASSDGGLSPSLPCSPLTVTVNTAAAPASSALSSTSSDIGYHSGRDSVSPRSDNASPELKMEILESAVPKVHLGGGSVWRPF